MLDDAKGCNQNQANSNNNTNNNNNTINNTFNSNIISSESINITNSSMINAFFEYENPQYIDIKNTLNFWINIPNEVLEEHNYSQVPGSEFKILEPDELWAMANLDGYLMRYMHDYIVGYIQYKFYVDGTFRCFSPHCAVFDRERQLAVFILMEHTNHFFPNTQLFVCKIENAFVSVHKVT